MSDTPRFSWVHAVTAVALIGIGWALAYSGPIGANYSPQLRSLVKRLHAQTLQKLHDDSTMALQQLRIASRDSAIEKLATREAAQLNLSRSLASSNQRLVDSLAKLHPDAAPLIHLLSQGIANQDSACTNAVSACDLAKDSLRLTIKEQKATIDTLVPARNNALALATDATEATRAAEAQAKRVKAQLWATRAGAILAVILGILK